MNRSCQILHFLCQPVLESKWVQQERLRKKKKKKKRGGSVISRVRPSRSALGGLYLPVFLSGPGRTGGFVKRKR